MKTVELKLYTIDELAPDSRQKAIDKWRENDDLPLLDMDMQDHFAEELEKNDFEGEDGELFYSLAYCQGDGVSFTGHFRYRDTYNVHVYSTKDLYCHKYTTSMEITDDDGNIVDTEAYEQVRDAYYKVCDTLEKIGYEYIDEAYDEDNIVENMRVNGYYFEIDGTINYEHSNV